MTRDDLSVHARLAPSTHARPSGEGGPPRQIGTDEPPSSSRPFGFVLGVVASVGLHGATYGVLLGAPRAPADALPVITVEVVEKLPDPPPPPEPKSPAPVREAVAPKSPSPRPPAAATARPTSAEPRSEPPKVSPEPRAFADLRGLTLSNDSAETFAAPAGDAEPGPPVPFTAMPAGPAVSKGPREPARRPEIVALRDLSKRPEPPDLDAVLRAQYPADARLRGIGGSARIRARVDADGEIREAAIVSETFAGFGEACRRTLAGSRWSAPRDARGRPVATEIVYTCHFEVSP